MSMIHSIPGAADSAFFKSPQEIPLPEVYVIRPMIRVPRSAQREYTDSELSTAAAMLAKMRLRRDVIDELRKHADPVSVNADRALDLIADRLLDLI
jgi:hypothetical protein